MYLFSLYLENNNYMEGINGSAYPSQNLYVQPPSRSMLEEAKSNLAPRGRSRNPLLDSVSLSQLDRPTSAMDNNNTSGKLLKSFSVFRHYLLISIGFM